MIKTGNRLKSFDTSEVVKHRVSFDYLCVFREWQQTSRGGKMNTLSKNIFFIQYILNCFK